MSAPRSFEMQHVSSFAKFSAVHKSKLTTRYPFLSVNQINGKLKDMWKNLTEDERNKYMKTTVKLTPEKHQGAQKTKRTPKNKKSPCRKTSKKKTETLNVCETPEYVNVEKLGDFRKKHSVNYENDFSMFDELVSQNGNKEKLQKPEGTWDNSFDDAAMDIDDDSQDPDAILITRGDTYAFTDSGSYTVSAEENIEDKSNEPEVDTKVNQTEATRKTAEVNQTEATRKTAESEKPKNADINDVPKSKRGRKRKSTEPNTLKDARDNQENSQPDDGLFKSPDPKKTLRKSNRQATKNQQTPNLLTSGVSEKLRKPQTTPIAPISDSNAENYTTPQMDEVLQKLALDEANKAPQKRRQSNEAEMNDKLKAITAGRRATRSLLALHSKQAESGKTCVHDDQDKVPVLGVQEQKESVASVRDNIVKQRDIKETEETSTTSRRRKSRGKQSNYEPKSAKKRTGTSPVSNERFEVKSSEKQSNSTVPLLDPSGDASQHAPNQGFDNMNSLGPVNVEATGCAADCKSNELSEFSACAEMVKKNGKLKKAKDRKTQNHSPDNVVQSLNEHRHVDTVVENSSPSLPSSSQDKPLSLPDYQEIQVTPASVPSSLSSLVSLRKLTKQHDPLNYRLEKVLEGLQMTGLNGSKAWETISDSDVNSPRLLSPALSGMSELSSRSSSSQLTEQSYSSLDGYIPFSTDGDHTLHQATLEDGGGGILCDMFDAATPPNQKTHGLYKTKRYLASGGENEGSKMKDLFERDMLDDICG